MTSTDPIQRMLARAVPPARVTDVVAWAEEHVRLPGSVRSERFDSSITPWTREPIQRIDDGVTTRTVFVKPIQAGGSVVGEIALCYWAGNKSSGDIQYNWQNDEQADGRWLKRIEKILRACKPVAARWPEAKSFSDRSKSTKGQVIFPHCNLTCQGVLTARRVASDSITYQVNEEVHDEEGWLPGRIDQAFGRLTAASFPVALVISNAGRKGSELQKAFLAGSQQHWEVLCPGCGEYHVMRARWEDKKPELGGLRYNSEGCRLEDGEYDYPKLSPTIRYQFPCGHSIPDDISIRRALSLSGRYGAPRNPGAPADHRSYTLEAVSVDYIPWRSLIQQKHGALQALKWGDPEPWSKYLRERECIFADETDRPVVGRVVLSQAVRDRNGLPGRFARFASIDRQQGSLAKGELPHWWCVIRDVMPSADSLLVWEGKLLTDEDAAEVVKRHEVLPRHTVVDSGDDTTHVYQFCLRYGFHAIKGGIHNFYAHAEGGKRIFSEEKPLHLMLGSPPTKPESPLDEPLFWFYSKAGIRERLHWLRSTKEVKWEVPSDVSSDYLSHMEAEEMETRRDARGAEVNIWIQRKPRNDLFVCECYIAMLMEMGGLIGAAATAENQSQNAL